MLKNSTLVKLSLKNGISAKKPIGLIYGQGQKDIEVLVPKQESHFQSSEISVDTMLKIQYKMALKNKYLLGVIRYYADMPVFLSGTDEDTLKILQEFNPNIFTLVFNDQGETSRFN